MSDRVAIALLVPEADLPETVERLSGQIGRLLDAVGFEGALSLAVVDDVRMRELNRDYHATDAATDVLAFPMEPEPGADDAFAAEVIVSLDTARREAAERGVETAAELMLYVTHGVLHLMGEDDHDPEDAERMHARTGRDPRIARLPQPHPPSSAMTMGRTVPAHEVP